VVLWDEENKTWADALSKQPFVTSISRSTLARNGKPGESVQAARTPPSVLHDTGFQSARLLLRAEMVGMYEDTK
jgi:hypothetical protein